MQFDMLMQTSSPLTYKHDPGGKVRLRMDPDITSTALISVCGKYRPLLIRTWCGQKTSPRTALFIGMNPSTADSHWDCPTCQKERFYARDILGMDGYVKCNVMDYRATDPTLLLRTPDAVCSDMNLKIIADNVESADTIVLCTGNLNQRFIPHMRDLRDLLKGSGKDIWCFGHNASGYTRHPLYLRRDFPLQLVDWDWMNKAIGTPR